MMRTKKIMVETREIQHLEDVMKIVVETREIHHLEDVQKMAKPLFSSCLKSQLVEIASASSPTEASRRARRELGVEHFLCGQCRWLAYIRKYYGEHEFRRFVDGSLS